MKTKKITRQFILAAAITALSCSVSFAAPEAPEAQQFMSGFNAFKERNYGKAIEQFTPLLIQPDSQLRELALVFIARSYFKTGKTDEAAFALNLWKEEFPESTLKGTLEQDLVNAVAKVEPKALAAIRQRKEQERIARERAEQQRLAAIRAEEERKAREKAEAERIAREKAEAERIAREKAEAERIAREKAETERIAREKAAAERLAKHKGAILSAAGSPGKMLKVAGEEPSAIAGRESLIPLTISNPGTMPDRLSITADLPDSYRSRLMMGGKPVTAPIELEAGSHTTVQLALTLPSAVMDGQTITIPVTAVSELAAEQPVSGKIQITASAPIVRAVVKSVDRVAGNPGRAECLISLLNVGSAAAEPLTLTIGYSSAFEPMLVSSAPFSKVSGKKLKSIPLKVASGDLQEFRIEFTTTDKSSPGELSCKAAISME